jgi:hypothetical protein
MCIRMNNKLDVNQHDNCLEDKKTIHSQTARDCLLLLYAGATGDVDVEPGA